MNIQNIALFGSVIHKQQLENDSLLFQVSELLLFYKNNVNVDLRKGVEHFFVTTGQPNRLACGKGFKLKH